MPGGRIYICAAKSDVAAAAALHQALNKLRLPGGVKLTPEAKALRGRGAFFRHKHEQSREPFVPEHLLRRIRTARAVVLICSPTGSVSKWIRTELNAFYEMNPAGKVIPVVVEGDPHPEESPYAYEKPALPDNISTDDAENWIDARHPGWTRTVPALVLAQLLNLPVEMLVHQYNAHQDGMRFRARFATSVALLVIAAAGLWVFRTPLDGLARQHVPGYTENVASHVEPWLDNHLLDQIAAELPPTIEIVRAPEPAEPQPDLGDPQAVRAALDNWINQAQETLASEPKQAQRWLTTTQTLLEQADANQYLDKRYRYHRLAAEWSVKTGEPKAAQPHMQQAVDLWTKLPAPSPSQKEDEAYKLLAEIATLPEGRPSALHLFNWIVALGGNEQALIGRARRLISLAETHIFLSDPIDSWLGMALTDLQPLPNDPAETKARIALLRAELGHRTGNTPMEEERLHLGKEELIAAQANTPLLRALRAQFTVREVEHETTREKVALSESWDGIINDLRSGVAIPEWSGWFRPDLGTALFENAGILFLAEGYAAAATAYREAVDHFTEPGLKVDALLRAGCAFRYSFQHEQASEAFSEALALLPPEDASEERITALYGAHLAASKLMRGDDANRFLAEARVLESKLPDYRPPKYWREETATLATVEPQNAESIERNARIATLQTQIQLLESDPSSRRDLGKLQQLQDLYTQMDRLYREQITGSAEGSALPDTLKSARPE